MSYADDYFDDYALEIHLNTERLKQEMAPLTDMEFADYILENSSPDTLNNVIKSGDFPAYKIAGFCKRDNKMTIKQREAIQNVFLHAYA